MIIPISKCIGKCSGNKELGMSCAKSISFILKSFNQFDARGKKTKHDALRMVRTTDYQNAVLRWSFNVAL